MKALFKRFIYIIWGKCQKFWILNNVVHYIYLNITSKFISKPNLKDCYNSNFGKPKVAFICDEMTWSDFNSYCDAVFLHTKTWREQLEKFQPDILFCESAWRGIDKYNGCWRAKIYKNKTLAFENRKELLNIIAFCRKNKIVTVFWNKEDPVYFNHPVYNFTDTALLFDYIFTTAHECIKLYQDLGHNKVFPLLFGVNTKMFFPNKAVVKENSVLFAGSWFKEHKERCKALEKIFDYVLHQGWKLDIFNRQFYSSEEKFSFPQKYNKYIHPPVSFKNMPQLTRQYAVCINVNTVIDSKTMFSRRVLQLLACGVKVLSNYSAGMENALGDGIKIRIINHDIVEISCDFAFIKENHSTYRRLNYVFNIVNAKGK